MVLTNVFQVEQSQSYVYDSIYSLSMVKKASLYREMLIAFSSEPTVAAILLKLIWIEIELNAVIFEVSSRMQNNYYVP